ncbi:MAG: L-seryl-tRNA(Sec) selenium transferase [Chloroflexota bacterium]
MVDLSCIPSVDKLINDSQAKALTAKYGRALTLSAMRETQENFRQKLSNKQVLPSLEDTYKQILDLLETWLKPTLVSAINASGVILHTNLGRAPLSAASLQAISEIASGYSTLEYDLEKGKRGYRLLHAEKLLKLLTGTEAAIVINNNAGAVLLVLSALAKRRKVIVSRTQMIEIGGGFRIPDVMRQSGAKLIEIGTTNRVHLGDYEKALSEPTGMILIAHHSNFKVLGFSTEPQLSQIVSLAHANQVPVLHDLGSGALLNTEDFGLEHEPTVQESLAAGCDIVCFSGDKLLGGPQAGIIIGRQDLIQKIRKHPLARALRADKLCLAALSTTLTHYLKEEADSQIPVWQMLSKNLQKIKEQAENWSVHLDAGEVIPGKSTTGGGSLPEEELDTYLLALKVPHINQFMKKLRTNKPPVIARILKDQVVFDPRTVLDSQEAALLRGINKALKP